MDTTGPKLNLLKAAGSILNVTPQREQKPLDVGLGIKCQCSALGLVHCQTLSQNRAKDLCVSVQVSEQLF